MHNGISVGNTVHLDNTPQRLQQQRQHAMPQYMMEQGGDPGYYVALGSNGHIGPCSPGNMMASPMSIADQCSPSVMQPATCHYRHSTKPSTIPATMNHFAPAYTSTLSPSSHLHTADTASPMYAHMGSDGFHPEGACTMQSIPLHPPPNYSEATAMPIDVQYHGPLPPPYYNSTMIGTEYSSQSRPQWVDYCQNIIARP